MRNKSGRKNMGIWLTLHTIIIVSIAVSATLFVEITATIRGNGKVSDGIFKALGIILPMCAALTFYNIFMFKSAYRHVNLMSDGIAKIADGDFSVRLDTKGAKSMVDVYENINTMAKELQNMAIMKNDFINNYSHEFKTPIACINGFAELLLRGQVSQQDNEKYLKVIYEESNRLARLAESTILLSKLDNQNIIDNKVKYNLDEQLRQCGIALSRQWAEKNINLTCDLDKVSYIGNQELMKQVWLNLMVNAIKFTPVGGEIIVLLKKVNNEIIVSVADSGKGMSEEQVANIFDRYYQVDKSGQSVGLGLGLAIAKRIVDMCGGKIEVQSTPKLGSTFAVTLQVS